MKFVGLVLILWLITFTAPAADFPEPFEIIQQEGQFVFTDGSSYYLFKKDHSCKKHRKLWKLLYKASLIGRTTTRWRIPSALKALGIAFN